MPAEPFRVALQTLADVCGLALGCDAKDPTRSDAGVVQEFDEFVALRGQHEVRTPLKSWEILLRRRIDAATFGRPLHRKAQVLNIFWN